MFKRFFLKTSSFITATCALLCLLQAPAHANVTALDFSTGAIPAGTDYMFTYAGLAAPSNYRGILWSGGISTYNGAVTVSRRDGQAFTLDGFDILTPGNTLDYFDSNLVGVFSDGSETIAPIRYAGPYYGSISQAGSSGMAYGNIRALTNISVLKFEQSGYIITGIRLFSTPGVPPVPEPETYMMLLAGLSLLWIFRRKRLDATTAHDHYPH